MHPGNAQCPRLLPRFLLADLSEGTPKFQYLFHWQQLTNWKANKAKHRVVKKQNPNGSRSQDGRCQEKVNSQTWNWGGQMNTRIWIKSSWLYCMQVIFYSPFRQNMHLSLDLGHQAYTLCRILRDLSNGVLLWLQCWNTGKETGKATEDILLCLQGNCTEHFSNTETVKLFLSTGCHARSCMCDINLSLWLFPDDPLLQAVVEIYVYLLF